MTTLGTADEWVEVQPNRTMLDSASLKRNLDEVHNLPAMYFGANRLKG